MKSQTSTQPSGETLAELRKRTREEALHKLVYQTLTSLDTVIMGMPSGPERDKLTEANIILRTVVEEA